MKDNKALVPWLARRVRTFFVFIFFSVAAVCSLYLIAMLYMVGFG